MNDKLIGFPVVNYITLDDAIDRQEFMESQLNRYNITHNKFVTQRLNDMHPDPIVSGRYAYGLDVRARGISVSFLKCLKHWYYNTNEEMAIFCEDDHDFSSIDSWTFSWKEFLNALPQDWECIQIIRIVSPYGEGSEHSLNLKMTYGRWWGSSALMRRSWVKKILDRNVVGDNEYKLELDDIQPIAENILFLGLGNVFNFPLVVENNGLNKNDIIRESTDEDFARGKLPHRMSEKVVRENWKNLDPQTKIEDMLRL